MVLFPFLAPSAPSVPPVGVYDCIRTAPFHPSVHNLGNVGWGGALHAAGARRVCRWIDAFAYKGVNMRRSLSTLFCESYPDGTHVLDAGCGTGVLTGELCDAGFLVRAVDTSEEMVRQARMDEPRAEYEVRNIADLEGRVDVSVACMVFHELPATGWGEALESMFRVTAGDVWVVDVDPRIRPTSYFLAGEPYLPKYLEAGEAAIRKAAHKDERRVEEVALVPGRVMGWRLRRLDGAKPRPRGTGAAENLARTVKDAPRAARGGLAVDPLRGPL